jgi:aspartyl-tRNA(Asn)/glutamyl-tRNA(Gln) amidotransferase subunit B
MFLTGKSASSIIAEKDLGQISDTTEIENIIAQVITNNSQAVSDFKAGKQQSLAFLVGQVMKATKGRANPGLANKILLDKLGGN